MLKEYETELYSTSSDSKAVFIERFNRTFLHIINEPMFINGDSNWVDIINDAVLTYNNNVHSTIDMTPNDASNNPDKVKYTFSFTNNKPKLRVGDNVRNAEIIEGKFYEKELLKSEFDFESNNKVLESLDIDLRS